jgi:GDPmannose 4,6-dehydratase
MRALITGVTGQDGRYLALLLKSQNYEVHGLTRFPINSINPEILEDLAGTKLHSIQYNNYEELKNVIKSIDPQLIFNLSGMSSVHRSFSYLQETFQANLFIVEMILKAVIELGLKTSVKIYQASSSEMYGASRQTPQNEKTSFNPISPYGISKLSAHHLCQQYRNREELFVSTGILYNHESPKRSEEFVSRKITQNVARISLGMSKELVLGNLDASRDWGHARDYVDAMLKIIKHDEPDDFVISTGVGHSVLDFVKESFKAVGMEGEEAQFLKSSIEFTRKEDHSNLVGNATKAYNELHWEPKVDFRMLVAEMIEHDLEKFRG